jgi:hypothetical protein
MTHRADAVDRIMREVAQLAPQLHPLTLLEIEAHLRKRFGGRSIYIRKEGARAWLRSTRGPWFGSREAYVPSSTDKARTARRRLQRRDRAGLPLVIRRER